ncbi:neuropilin and tolloid-like protein 1 [Saccoglossus kowalevskii]
MASNLKRRTSMEYTIIMVLCVWIYRAGAGFELVHLGREARECGVQIIYGNHHYEGGRIHGYPLNEDSRAFTQCNVTIIADKRQKLYLRFVEFSIPSKKSDCSDHYLKIYDGDSTDMRAPLLTGRHGLCNSNTNGLPASVLTTTKAVTFQLYRKDVMSETDFEIIYSAIEKINDGACFLCSDDASLCIDPSLVCDGLENCEDGSDETDCPETKILEDTDVGLSLAILAIIVVLMLVVVSGTVCIMQCRHKYRRSRNIRTDTNTSDNHVIIDPIGSDEHESGNNVRYFYESGAVENSTQIAMG